MARLREQRLYDAFKKIRPKGIRIERVENVVSDGTPDVMLFVPGATVWVELKAPLRPKRATTRLLGGEGLRQSQLNWMLEATQYQIPAYVLIRDNSGDTFLIPAACCEGINELTAGELRAISLADSLAAAYEVINENRTTRPPRSRGKAAPRKP